MLIKKPLINIFFHMAFKNLNFKQPIKLNRLNYFLQMIITFKFLALKIKIVKKVQLERKI